MSTALLTPTELAEKLGLSVQTIYNLRSNGGPLPPAIMIGRRIRYQSSDVDTWLQGKYEHDPVSQETKAIRQIVPTKRGRPSKEETIRKRIRADKANHYSPLKDIPAQSRPSGLRRKTIDGQPGRLSSSAGMGE